MSPTARTAVGIEEPGARIELLMVPPEECSPNWRGHTRSRAKKRAIATLKNQAGWAAKIAQLDRPGCFDHLVAAAEIVVDVEIAWPPGRGTMDDDNAWGSLKAARDGIARQIGINDRRFRQGELRQGRGTGTVTFWLRPA